MITSSDQTLSSPFGSPTRTRVLVALRLLGSSFPRELARLLEVSPSLVLKALASLERDALVAGRPVGRSRVYTLNPRYFAKDALERYLLRLSQGDSVLCQDRYVHPLTAFFVEFPPGPLSIGGDLDIHPVALKVAGSTALILSATDSCRDRLCAFYFWDDRQSLDLAVAIARRNPVDLDVIRRWSRAEGAAQKYQEFRRHIARRSRRG